MPTCLVMCRISDNIWDISIASGEAALNERSYREWCYKIKKYEDCERSGRSKMYEDEELESLLKQHLCHTQKELRRDSTSISASLKILGNDSKAKPSFLQMWNSIHEMVVSDDEKSIHYDNPKKRKSCILCGHRSTDIALRVINFSDRWRVWAAFQI